MYVGTNNAPSTIKFPPLGRPCPLITLTWLPLRWVSELQQLQESKKNPPFFTGCPHGPLFLPPNGSSKMLDSAGACLGSQ